MLRRVRLVVFAALLVVPLTPGTAGAASDSAVRWSSFSESSQCGSPYVGSPIMSRSGSLSDAERILGPLARTFGRSIGEVRQRLTWWTVPNGAGRRVQVHELALPAFQQVTAELAAEQAAGRVYPVTSAAAFVPRTIGGERQLSRHALGIAIDLNPAQNPYTSDPDRLVTDMPSWYVDAWRRAGFCWGGDWVSAKDPMHFAWKGPGTESTLPLLPPRGSEAPYGLAATYPTPADHLQTPVLADFSGFGALDVVAPRSHPAGTVLDIIPARARFAACAHQRMLLPFEVGDDDRIVYGDIDGDSREDMVVLGPDGSARVAARADGFGEPVTVQLGAGIAVAAIGDHDGDRRGDLYSVDGDGGLTVRAGPIFDVELASADLGSGVDDLSIGDRDGDGTVEVFVRRGTEVEIRSTDPGLPIVETATLPAAEARAFAVADEDGDGRADLAVLTAGGTISVLTGNTPSAGPVDAWWADPGYDCPDRPVPFQWVGTFFDDDLSEFEVEIERIAAVGVTRGCNPPFNDAFCVQDPVTRGQMAAFLVRALGLGPATRDHFTDDDDSVFQDDINRLAEAGVTRGCAADRFCLHDPVTRGQMAAFLGRGFDLPGVAPSDSFVDDDDSVFEGDIERLAASGITRGCDPPANTRYCPDAPVTRGQMAAFLVRSLDRR